MALKFTADDFKKSEEKIEDKPTTQPNTVQTSSETQAPLKFTAEDFAGTGGDKTDIFGGRTFRQVASGQLGKFGKTTAGMLVIDGVLAPMAEVARGVYKGTSSFMGKLDAATILLERTMGIPRGGAFGEMADAAGAEAEKIPDTAMHPIAQTTYQLMGGAVPIVTEFALAKKLLGATGFTKVLEARKIGALSETSEFALIGALDEYSKDPQTASLWKGAREGATIQMMFAAGGKIMVEGAKLLQRTHKSAAEMFIRFVTGDKKAAKEFVNNPDKFILDPRVNTQARVDLAKENKAATDTLKRRHRIERDIHKTKIRREQQLLDSKLSTTRSNLKEVQRQSEESLKANSKQTLDDVMSKASKAIDDHTKTVTEKVVAAYDDTLTQYQTLKKQTGKRVERAIRNTVKADPGAALPYQTVDDVFESITKEKAPFNIKKEVKGATKKFKVGGREFTQEQLAGAGADVKALVGEETAAITARTAAAKQSEVSVFKRIYNEIKGFKKQGDVPLVYLQNLKTDLHTLSNSAFEAGNNELGLYYQELSKSMNPANIVSNNKSLAGKFSELAEANKAFHEFAPKYEEAMKRFFVKNANGQYVPDIDKAIRAVKKGDTVAIREMVRADSALPPDAKILPRVRIAVREMEAAEVQQAAIIKNAKKKARQDLVKLQKASRESTRRLDATQKTLRIGDKETAARQIAEFQNKAEAEYLAVLKKLDQAEEFLRKQDLFRSSIASRTTMANLFQRMAGFSTLGALTGRPGVAVQGALAAVGLMPVVSASLTKGAIKGGELTTRVLRGLVESEIARKAIIRTSIEVQKKKKKK